MSHFVAPLKADCEDLLSQFQRTESVRYEEFSAIWRKMDFPSIFYGKMADNEKRSFGNLVLATAYHYFLPPYTFQIRVGGLYLLYGLYHTQLAVPREKIWMALKDWEDIMQFEQDAINAQHYDVVYILRKLFSEKAFYFCAMPKPLSYHVDRKSKRHKVCEEFRQRPERVRDLVNMEMLEEIMHVQHHYEKIKLAISSTPGQLDPGINIVRQDLVSQLRSTVTEYHNWREHQQQQESEVKAHSGDAGGDADGDAADDAGEGTSERQECSERAERLAAIKSKSYGQLTEAVKSRRHRQVEMDTSGSGTDTGAQGRKSRRRPSLRMRTQKNLVVKAEAVEQEVQNVTRQWRLTERENKAAVVQKKHKKFKW